MNIRLPNLALFKRTVLMDNRSWHGYVARGLLLGAIAIILINFVDEFRYSTFGSAPGLQFLSSLAILNLIAISLLGVAAFAPAITEEKEVDTLGLLMMTGLSPLATLLSKGGSKLLMGIALVAAQVPFTFLAVTLGGVSPLHITAVYITLATYMALVAGVSIFFSTLCRNTPKAGGASMIAIVLLNLIPALYPYMRWISPFLVMDDIFTTGFQGPVFPIQCAFYLGTGLAFFLLAWLLFDVNMRTDAAGGVTDTISKKGRRMFPIGRAWRNPMAWKAFHFDVGGIFTQIVISFTLLACLALLLYSSSRSCISIDTVGTYMLTIGTIAFLLEGAHISSSVIRGEINENTLSTLLTTPSNSRYIFHGKILGASLMTIPTILFALIGGGLIFFHELSLSNPFEYTNTNDIFDMGLSITLIAMIALLYFHLTAYLSLYMKYGAFIVAGFAMWLGYMFFVFFIGIAGSIGYYGGRQTFEAIIIMLILIHSVVIPPLHLKILRDMESIAGKS